MIAHVIVSGRVQGVGFRYSVYQKALEQGICGWVRNLEDGTVELEIEGTKEALDNFLETIKTGLHLFIKITGMDVHYSNEEKGYRNFWIKYE
ncbi:acylphosphatase [Fervidibacillus albus]|uniref:Acylphosphatase n=1 Tax=Fervidibacillus albus TaxID=2980026 RepID=A0A9E8LUV6_9BACI|nr:acylphosphatase [Fervidibacillus albus]WAA09770.1 acylphosphatase [Fervidibacillus albus]